MSRARLIVLLLLAASGCAVDDRTLVLRPEPILIDDFEDGDGLPLDPRFGGWEYSTFNTNTQRSAVGSVQPGFNSRWCMRADWTVADKPDGMLNYPGFLVLTRALASIDLTSYTHINFVHRYQHVDSCVALPDVYLDIVCSELDSSFVAPVPVSSTWATASVALADLIESPFAPPRGTLRGDCLKVADTVEFITQSNYLLDGQCLSGSLFLDDVSITAD